MEKFVPYEKLSKKEQKKRIKALKSDLDKVNENISNTEALLKNYKNNEVYVAIELKGSDTDLSKYKNPHKNGFIRLHII